MEHEFFFALDYTLFMEEILLKGKKALVVGGSGGIGREISILLARNGTDLTIHGSAMSEKFSSLVQEIRTETGRNSEVIAQNLLDSTFSELESSPLFAAARKTDILCVCFGPFVQKPLHETNLQDWEKVALFDYALPGLLISAALPNMMKNNFGRILLFGGTGTSHRTEFSTNSAYAGAKSGLNVLVSSIAANYAGYGITCNAIMPGFVETEYISESQKSVLASKMPLGSMICANKMAENALFLLKNADINGTWLRADRGWSPKS